MDQTRYREAIDQAVRLLEGQFKEVGEELLAEMEQAAEELRFEKAAELRDRFKAIELLGKRQKVVAGSLADTTWWASTRGRPPGAALWCSTMWRASWRPRTGSSSRHPWRRTGRTSSPPWWGSTTAAGAACPRQILLPCELEDAVP